MAASSASDMAGKRGSRALILETVAQSGLTLRSLAEPKSGLASETQHEILYILAGNGGRNAADGPKNRPPNPHGGRAGDIRTR